jgi:CBS domain-containing protein
MVKDHALKMAKSMQVQRIMTQQVHSIGPGDTIIEAAQSMAENDVGVLPVIESGQLIGIVTDRDIAVRGIAGGVSPSMPVRRIMSRNVASCSPDDSIEDALGTMANEQVRRLPVCDDQERLVGIIGLGDAANRDPDASEVGATLSEICQPTGLHCQTPALAC